MKALGKTVIGGVVLTAALGAASYYTHNHVIPENMANELNATISDIYEKNTISEDVIITKSGDITVTPTGLFTYKAIIPEVTINNMIDLDGENAKFTLKIEQSEYDVAVEDKANAVLAAVGADKDMNATLVSSDNIKFSSSLTPLDPELANEVSITAQGKCDEVTVNSALSGNAYSVNTMGKGCTLSGMAGEKDNFRNMIEMNSGFTFNSNISNDGSDVFAGKNDITFNNMSVSEASSGEEYVNIRKIELGLGYDGQSSVNPEATDIDLFDLSLYPQNIKFSFNMEGLQIPALSYMSPKTPEINVNAGLGLGNIKKNEGKVAVEFGYNLSNLEEISNAYLSLRSPTKASCKVELDNVPMQTLSETLNEIAQADYNAQPGDILAEGKLLDALKKAGISVNLDCKASTPDKYSSSLEVAHQYENGSFPGEGTLELRGVEEIMAELTTMLGQDAQSLTAMFMAFAEPTEDGEGLSWQYSLDKNGNLTVNNQPLGPVVPSLSP